MELMGPCSQVESELAVSVVSDISHKRLWLYIQASKLLKCELGHKFSFHNNSKWQSLKKISQNVKCDGKIMLHKLGQRFYSEQLL